jgi:hypothetical protein
MEVFFTPDMANFTIIAAYLLSNATANISSLRGGNTAPSNSWVPILAGVLGIGGIVLLCCILSCGRKSL